MKIWIHIIFILCFWTAYEVWGQLTYFEFATGPQTFPGGPSPGVVSRTKDFTLPGSAKSTKTQVDVYMSQRDLALDVDICLERKGSGKADYEKNNAGQFACGCGMRIKPGEHLDKQGVPLTQYTITCSGSAGGQAYELPPGTSYRHRITAANAEAKFDDIKTKFTKGQ